MPGIVIDSGARATNKQLISHPTPPKKIPEWASWPILEWKEELQKSDKL